MLLRLRFVFWLVASGLRVVVYWLYELLECFAFCLPDNLFGCVYSLLFWVDCCDFGLLTLLCNDVGVFYFVC